MAKSAKEKLNQTKAPKRVVLEKDFAGIRAGQRMLVGTPQMVDAYIREIPSGETRTIHRLRNELARREKCDATCPVSTAIFVRISAEAAIEDMDAGRPESTVTPFWRIISADDKVAAKLPIDPEWITRQRALEAAS
ncbi:MAG: hypothetical protein AAF417_20370 [Pseudomonadota bacterium]